MAAALAAAGAEGVEVEETAASLEDVFLAAVARGGSGPGDGPPGQAPGEGPVAPAPGASP